MTRIRLAAAVALAGGAATAGGVHWIVDAPTSDDGGFIAYGVLFVRDGGIPENNGAHADALDFFASPYVLGPETFDFGGALPLAATDAGAASSSSGELSILTAIDGDGSDTARVTLRADGASTRLGTASYEISNDPNNRAVFELAIEDADPSRPVRISFDWTVTGLLDTPAPYAPDVTTTAQVSFGRSGDIFLTQVGSVFANETHYPLDRAGSRLVTLAGDDLDRPVLVAARLAGGYGFSAPQGAAGPEAAAGFEIEFLIDIHVRQYCPGDTDGDNLVNFADLNVIVGSFNATGPVGEHAGDINGDGVVDFADLNMTLTNFGQSGC